jgi:2-dehydro-3-deoxyphosphogluconate aldolase/(4S)-4-hydroxy-2-oxoglutarate aldolase
LVALEAVATRGSESRLEVGAGTVLTLDAARRALDAGARFLVMPHVDTEIVAWAAERGIPAFPGAATPTEVLAGWRAGAAAIKVFPASVLGLSFVRELRGPLPEIPLLPTGGVTLDNAASFIRAGAAAIGLGGWLLGDGQAAGVRDRAREIVSVVAAARTERT